MRLKQLSVLLVAAVLALGVAGCKKNMDRVTPLPGYGAGGKIGDGSLSGNIPTGEKLPTGDGNANANPNPVPFDPKAPIPFSGKRSIEGRPQDREKFKDQIVYFEFDRSTVRSGDAAKVQETYTHTVEIVNSAKVMDIARSGEAGIAVGDVVITGTDKTKWCFKRIFNANTGELMYLRDDAALFGKKEGFITEDLRMLEQSR